MLKIVMNDIDFSNQHNLTFVHLSFFYDVNGNIHLDCESFANEAIRLVKLYGVKAFQEMNYLMVVLYQ